MADLLTMLLVASDPRRNPAAKLVARQASKTRRAVSDLAQLAWSGAAAIGSLIAKELIPKDENAESSRCRHKSAAWQKEEISPCAKVWFFERIGKHGVKLHILVSQLNELAHINKGDDQQKKYKARNAQRTIEALQDEGLLILLGDATDRARYADAEIIKVARKFAKGNHKLIVLTNDKDLKIRVNSIDGVYCMSMPELYESDVKDDKQQ